MLTFMEYKMIIYSTLSYGLWYVPFKLVKEFKSSGFIITKVFFIVQ